jgi:hypothetical protein
MQSELQEQEGNKPNDKPLNVLSQDDKLFHIAFAERRKINLDKLKQYVTARSISHKERTRIYMALQTLYREKIEYTKNFIKDFIKYF